MRYARHLLVLILLHAAIGASSERAELSLPASYWKEYGLEKTRIGDFTETAYADSGEVVRIEVVSVQSRSIETKMTTTTRDGAVSSIVNVVSRYDGPEVKRTENDNEKEVLINDQELLVCGKKIKCVRHDFFLSGKLVARTWSSDEIPLGGEVRAEDGAGKVLREIKAWGRGASS